ncbi:MAG TPA: hypothetical protein VKA04_02640 [Pseudodesulfovibrio sp.]|nr:hypothetical protein [Pseudodesulfovibrio sp.]
MLAHQAGDFLSQRQKHHVGTPLFKLVRYQKIRTSRRPTWRNSPYHQFTVLLKHFVANKSGLASMSINAVTALAFCVLTECLIRPISIPTESEEAFRTLQRRRHQLTDSIRKVKQRIRALFLSFNVQEPPGIDKWGKKAVAEIGRIGFPHCADATEESLLRELHYLKEEQREVDGCFAPTPENKTRRGVSQP